MPHVKVIETQSKQGLPHCKRSERPGARAESLHFTVESSVSTKPQWR